MAPVAPPRPMSVPVSHTCIRRRRGAGMTGRSTSIVAAVRSHGYEQSSGSAAIERFKLKPPQAPAHAIEPAVCINAFVSGALVQLGKAAHRWPTVVG